MNLPQNITDRYINSLLRDGTNNNFHLMKMERHPMTVGHDLVGWYFSVTIQVLNPDLTVVERRGATPNEALSRCLLACGVTFAS